MEMSPSARKPLLSSPNKLDNKKTDKQGFSEDEMVTGHIEQLLIEQNSILRQILEKDGEDEFEKLIENRWRQVALVLDRLFFIIATITTTVVSAVILTNKPPYQAVLE